MQHTSIHILFWLGLLLFSMSSCRKYLDTKADQRLSTPETLEDLELLLNDPVLVRGVEQANTGSDEYYVTYNDWLPLSDNYKLGYIWAPDLDNPIDWRNQYKNIFNVNIILAYLNKVPANGQTDKVNTIKGSALFIRAHSLFWLAQLFAPQFNSTTASTDAGIPLRLNENFNEESTRATVQQVYDRIIEDAETAISLLPDNPPVKIRPSKIAGHAFLARVYLQMGDYAKAKEHADACLQINSSLVNYNTLSASAQYPLGDFNINPEVVFYMQSNGLNAAESRAKVDSTIYGTFAANDKRKTIYFRSNNNGTYVFKGNYTGKTDLFSGLALDEVYLIRAECSQRLGSTNAALQDLNALLAKRYDASFVPYTTGTAGDVLSLILRERTKQLLYRSLRWLDLRRLNLEQQYAKTIKRELNGQQYLLPPNDLRYTLLFPVEIILITNLAQNPR